jgi:hypothetical protein
MNLKKQMDKLCFHGVVFCRPVINRSSFIREIKLLNIYNSCTNLKTMELFVTYEFTLQKQSQRKATLFGDPFRIMVLTL